MHVHCFVRKNNKMFSIQYNTAQEPPPVLRQCFNQRYCCAIAHFNWYTPFAHPASPPAHATKSFPLVQSSLHLSATLPSVSSLLRPARPSIHSPSPILSLSIPLCLSVVPSLITVHPEDCCVLISYPSFLFAFLFIPASSLFSAFITELQGLHRLPAG